jgi:hypothetical protein
VGSLGVGKPTFERDHARDDIEPAMGRNPSLAIGDGEHSDLGQARGGCPDCCHRLAEATEGIGDLVVVPFDVDDQRSFTVTEPHDHRLDRAVSGDDLTMHNARGNDDEITG